MVKKRQKKESGGYALKAKRKEPRPIFVVAAASIFVLLVFSPNFFPAFPRRALTAIVAGAGALFALSLAASLLVKLKGKKALVLAASKRLMFALLFAGTILGALGVFRVHRSALPPLTLCPLESVTSAVAKLEGDASPWGKDFYRAETSLISFFSNGRGNKESLKSSFSASGKITLLIPASQAEAALPGRPSAGRKPLYLASGSVIECKGAFSSFSLKKNAGSPLLFRVSEIVDAKPPTSLAGKVMAARAHARLSIIKALYGWGEAGALLLALSCGARSFLDETVFEVFRLAGLSHILALSGMHLSILAGAVTFICSKLAGGKFASKATIAALALFLFFAGPFPSLLRAFLFTATLAATRRAGFKPNLLAVLAFVFCVHILIRPQDFYSLSFQLSYLATAGIFSIGAFFSEALDSLLPPKLCRPLAASFGAEAAVFPISMSTFGAFAPAGAIATLLLSAPISFFMISGIFCAALSCLSPLLYSLCGLFMKAQYAIIFAVASFFSRLPSITAGNNPLFAPLSMCALYALFLAALALILRALRQKRKASLAAA